ncbi:MAG: class I SAM-dependent methyltransferase [Alphaproteobacteria bacterium]|nr:class I SAM-dependent methyltransferase [Alphaproteobacteria bacterium]
MEDLVYARMAALEERHWWFVARRRILAAVLARFMTGRVPARILEAGCGTGGNLAMLSRWGVVSGLEPHPPALARARKRGPFDLRDGRLPEDIPFAPESFDLVAALDVIEHLDDDAAALRALAARLKPGGRILVTVPALPFLWSRHDDLHHHRRRYTRGSLLRLAGSAGLRPVWASYYNSVLFPLIAAIRLGKRMLGIEADEDRMPPPIVNRLFQNLFSMERHLLSRVPLPVGVSLILVAERPSAAGAPRP